MDAPKQTIKNWKSLHASMPNCCANCIHNFWQEDGIVCTNLKNWENIEDKEELEICIEESVGNLEWNTVCDNHKRGNYST